MLGFQEEELELGPELEQALSEGYLAREPGVELGQEQEPELERAGPGEAAYTVEGDVVGDLEVEDVQHGALGHVEGAGYHAGEGGQERGNEAGCQDQQYDHLFLNHGGLGSVHAEFPPFRRTCEKNRTYSYVTFTRFRHVYQVNVYAISHVGSLGANRL